jgi:hypothetical protein
MVEAIIMILALKVLVKNLQEPYDKDIALLCATGAAL